MEYGFDIIVVLGPTAGGKTSFAARLAYELDGEVISADSRQVYRKMDLGTGKDYQDYIVNGKEIPFHLIDIVDSGYKYNVYEYQNDFIKAYSSIRARNRIPVLCGGTGMYIEAVLKGYKLIHVPPDHALREELNKRSLEELTNMLLDYKKNLQNTTDLVSKKRVIRAIEIAKYYSENSGVDFSYPQIKPLIFGIKFDRPTQRKRITTRLKERLEEGMIEEVIKLMNKGVSAEDLIYYGLEYKYITKYLTGELSYDEMFTQLNTSIHQFAKRQMTWFRRMERKGFNIHWIDGHLPLQDKLIKARKIINESA